jgi:phospholipid-binding lipoprotein MlaA
MTMRFPASEKSLSAGLAAALVLALSTAAIAQDEDYLEGEDYLESDDAGVAVSDPLEPVNRAIFCFNDCVDQCFLAPLADTYDFIMPDVAQRSIRRLFANLRFPVNFLNNLLQAKPKEAGIDVARFLVNTTVGVAGLMDPANDWLGLEKNNEDFGQTLGYWGVPPGPFLMLPALGPSSVRDGLGSAVDSATLVYPYFLPFAANAALAGSNALNARSMIGDQLEQERAAALDWYAAVRSAYSQYRENLINDDARAADQESPILKGN